MLGLAGLLDLGCHRHQPALEPELTPPSAEVSDEAPGADPSVEFDIDLAPHGMAATIRAPRSAAVRATVAELEITAGPSYHLLVGRGHVDVLGEQARIVRAFGDEFRRFLRDDGETLVYETGSDDAPRYHLFMSATTRGHTYHCRTPPDGLPDRDAVEHLADACADVRFKTSAELPEPG